MNRVTPFLFAALLCAPVAHAQNLDQLAQRFDAAYDEGRYQDAEQFARRGLQAASRANNPVEVAAWSNRVGLALADQGKLEESEPFYKKALALREQHLGPDSLMVAQTRENLALAYGDLGRFDEAEPLFKSAIAVREKVQGKTHADLARGLAGLGTVYRAQARYDEAERVAKRTLVIVEKGLGPDHRDVAGALNNLASVYADQGRYRDAQPLCERALAIDEKALGADHPSVAQKLDNLAVIYAAQAQYARAEPLHLRALKIREKTLGADHPETAQSLCTVAGLYGDLARYDEVDALYKRAAAIYEKTFGADHPMVALCLDNRAILYQREERTREVEPLFTGALAIKEKALGPDHPDLARSLNNLGNFDTGQGRFADAEPLLKRALAIRRKAFGPENRDVAECLNNLARLYRRQQRGKDAESLSRQAVAVYEKALGPDHPDLAESLSTLGGVCLDSARYEEAEKLYQRALAIDEKAYGPDHPAVVNDRRNLAHAYRELKRFAEAETLFKQALASNEKQFGPDSESAVRSLADLAGLEEQRGNGKEAEEWLARATAGAERAALSPDYRAGLTSLQAILAYRAGRREEAIQTLAQSLRLGETERGQLSGSNLERAEAFVGFAHRYEVMVEWQTELGNAGAALDAIERSRSRSLLDELRMARVDLDAERPPAERKALAERESRLLVDIARLERLAALAPEPDQAVRLRAELAEARRELIGHRSNALATSAVYRRMIRTDEPPSLEQIQRQLVGEGGLLLVYLAGEQNGYVVAVTAEGARVSRLALGPAEAEVLGVAPGPLSAERLHEILLGGKTSGVVTRLAEPEGKDATPQLAALWRALVPEPERKALTDGRLKRLIVVPDGPLALLPFEALVVEQAADPKYLLDVGPPVVYGPSATVLLTLRDRAKGIAKPAAEPVLALGDPAYPSGDAAVDTSRGALSARARFSLAGGKLPRLPYSGVEAQWVAKAFNDEGVKASLFTGVNATEAGVRYWAPGRVILHLACHGLADLEYGNFFGGLALAPGAKADANPSDDGILTLDEICKLNLTGCELAILSACQTNFGPLQKGEGTLALSRGFLVAGARRVVASNWLVDDEAAASLVSVAATALARAEKAGRDVDYATSLRDAKRWVRRQSKWKVPYYWASLELVGPP